MESASSLGAAGAGHYQLTCEGREAFQESRDAVALTVEATNAQGGRQLFTSQNDAEFTMVDGLAVALFNHFTTSNNKE